MSNEELQVVKLKYAEKRVGLMQPVELHRAGKAMLLRIHIITGWTIPAEKELMDILVDQFNKCLAEKYGDLNPSEIEYAFRSKGTVVEDWGKSMNLNLLDKVLLPYLNDRYKISEAERQLAYRRTNANKPTCYRRMLEEDYQFFLSGKILTTFPVQYYPVLVEDGILQANDYMKFEGTADEQKDRCVLFVFENCKAAGYKNLYVQQ